MAVSNTWIAGVSLPKPAADWADRSLIAFAAPQQDGGLPANTTVSRDERRSPQDPPGESFADYAVRQGQVLAANLPGFQARTPTPLDGHMPGVADTLFSWRSGAISLTQWVVWMALPDNTVLSFTATAESSQFESHLALFDATLRSIHIEPSAFPAAT
jgi:hypothetical protein